MLGLKLNHVGKRGPWNLLRRNCAVQPSSTDRGVLTKLFNYSCHCYFVQIELSLKSIHEGIGFLVLNHNTIQRCLKIMDNFRQHCMYITLLKWCTVAEMTDWSICLWFCWILGLLMVTTTLYIQLYVIIQLIRSKFWGRNHGKIYPSNH